jgi:AcrR family transcriptional regulator
MARRAAAGTKDRILDVAALLFYRHGVRAVGMNQIIDEAGCGKNLLYGHFPSKSELVAEYLQRCRRGRDESVEWATRDAGDDPAASLVALTAEVAAKVREPGFRGCPFRNYLAEFPNGDDAPGAIASAYVLDTRAQVDALVDRLGVAEPDVLADRIWLIVEGLYGGAALPGAGRIAETAVTLVEELINGARRRAVDH